MNPYQILNIDNRAMKKDILLATAKALRERKFSGQEIAIAQKQLLSPVSKALLDYVCFIDLQQLQDKLRPIEIAAEEKVDLRRLTIFDNG